MIVTRWATPPRARRAGGAPGIAGARSVRLPTLSMSITTGHAVAARGVRCSAVGARWGALGRVRVGADLPASAIHYLEGPTWRRVLVAPGVYRLSS